ARRNRVFLMEALWSFFIPGVQKAFDLLEQGVIGELHTIRADLGFHMPPDDLNNRVYNKALGAGSLLDLGVYPAMLSLALLGRPERSDIMAMGTFTGTDVDATACKRAPGISFRSSANLRAMRPIPIIPQFMFQFCSILSKYMRSSTESLFFGFKKVPFNSVTG
ncbi:MAG: hypothetical protein RL013_961, partial [Bacteroidota bacterium]